MKIDEEPEEKAQDPEEKPEEEIKSDGEEE